LEIEVVLSQRSTSFRVSFRPAEVHRRSGSDVEEVLAKHLDCRRKTVADDFYKKLLDMKNVGGQTMIGTEVAVVFLMRCIQPVMSRAH
jgi:hypothetical protein